MDYTVIISTCDAYQDLWTANHLLLEQNWGKRGVRTLLVTDKPSNRQFENVELIAAGEGTQITERLAAALEKITTKYVLFTLDDYFLTEPIDSAVLQQRLAFMEKNNVDYLRLLPLTKHSIRVNKLKQAADCPGIYYYNENCDSYVVSLYPGLWRTDFMRKTVGTVRNAWQYEVALTDMARHLNAVCAASNLREFPFLDVIRKGKVLRKAKRYFKKHPIYQSERATMRARDEWMLNLRMALRHWLPRPLFKALKKRMSKHGYTFYSPIES